jgi:hypothetical protein
MIQLRVSAREQEVQQRALDAARESLQLMRNQYKEGLVDYLSVAVLENTVLGVERTAISLMGSRLVASVQLIAALGGGWNGNVDAPKMLPADAGAGMAPAVAPVVAPTSAENTSVQEPAGAIPTPAMPQKRP